MKTKLFLLVALFFTLLSVNAQLNSVAIVGERVGGWPNDPQVDANQLTRVTPTGDDWFIENLVVGSTGGLKLRGNNAWAVPYNWGKAASGADYPSNTMVVNANDIQNIPAGTYRLDFNSATGLYAFSGGTVIATVKIIGAATGGTPITMATVDGITYTYTGSLSAGGAQFEINDNAVPTPTISVVGGVIFPGVAPGPIGLLTDPMDSIQVTPAGNYVVTLDTGAGTYIFAAGNPKIAIVGSATTGGWPNDPQVDTNAMLTSDGEKYKSNNVLLIPGELKFRQDNGWANAWGGTAFPVGSASGSNLVVAAGQGGNYRAKFTRSIGDYSFDFPSVAIVGEAVGGWPPNPQPVGYTDPNLFTTTDGETYTITNLVVTTATAGGGAKFRWDNDWNDNSGGASFPTVAASSGDNIATTAGVYDVTYTRSTGAYTFTNVTFAVTSFEASGFKVFPNPTQNTWSFTSSKDAITNIQVADLLGKIIVNTSQNTIDASGVTTGVYFAKVSTEKGSATAKVVRN
ncbi:MAG: T9SS type A sorting domain-containing protein [Flavobacterium sp.]|nr:T9SS type A sorting domain-containing protein [Flavobacterium sp.]